jgi:hypothetical protein
MTKTTTIKRPVAPAVVSVPIMYHDWERHWYALLDFVQSTWSRFAGSRTGRFTIWFARVIVWTLMKALVYVTIGAVVIGCGVLYMALSFSLGNGKVWNGTK